jgi:tetratricopeptide (TPR) repeat protein
MVVLAKEEPEPKRPPKASDRQLAELERDAGKCRTARLALDKYEAFVACHELTPPQRQSIDGRMKLWVQRVDAGLCRVGNTWVTPAAAKEIGNAADALIEESYAKVTAGEFKRAKELLERAVRTDPSGTRADYLLGMLNSPNLWNYAPSAEKHFEHAYRRDPENASLANNLAISKIKMGQYGEALDLWAAALRSGNEVPEIVQNLSR